jgi:hypothetical protein
MRLWLLVPLALAACGQETPVEMGGLLPGGGVRTAEVVFDAPAFLEWDSVRTGFLHARNASFGIASHHSDGALDVHSLLRMHPMKRTVTYNDSTGTARVDSLPELVSGRLELRLDTIRTVGPSAVQMALYQIDESWDPSSANWTSRLDTGTVQLPWTEPGGTKGELIDAAQLTPGDSVVSFTVAPAVLDLMRDTTVNNLGLMLQVQTADARVQYSSATLYYEVRPAARPDSLVSDSVQIAQRIFLASTAPDPATVDGLLVGGLPTWRAYLRLKEGLDSLSVPCPGGPAGCMARLSDVVLNYAGIELQRLPGPPGFALADTAYLEPRTVLAARGVPVDEADCKRLSLDAPTCTSRLAQRLPIARTPLGVQAIGMAVVPPAGAAGTVVEVPVTSLISALVGDSIARQNAPRIMTLLSPPEGGGFGLSTFGSLASGPLAPRLRLVYSVTKEVEGQ